MTWKILTIAIAVPACAVDEPHVSLTTQQSGCSIVVCSENAATAGDGLLFDELHLRGEENYAGVRVIGADAPDGTPAHIDIEYDKLVIHASTGDLLGGSVVGSVIHFVHASGAHFDIRVDGFNEQLTYVAHDNGQRLPLYHLMARLVDSKDPKTEFEVCNHDPLTYDPSWSRTDLEHYAVLFRGDKYDGGTKTVVLDDVWSDWAFIACNGSAASKLHMWRHTSAGAYSITPASYPGREQLFPTTLDERTTLLKAITADYCGTGMSYTTNGTPLVFATSDDPSAGPASTTQLHSIEAMWSPAGATCLDFPRGSYTGTYKRDDIVTKCGHPFDVCNSLEPNEPTTLPMGWDSGPHVITANPIR